MKQLACSLLGIFALGVQTAHAQQVTESFEGAFPAAGWSHQNQSANDGPTPWAQFLQGAVPAHSGTHYAMSDYLAATNGGTISDWLITPEVAIVDGVTLRFWTYSPGSGTFADRMQVRMSTAGASLNVGTTATDVGDFTTLLLDINPTLTVGGYPGAYTEYVLLVTGVSVPTTGRFAFRYFVTNAGVNGAAVVLDDVVVTAMCGNGSIDSGETCDDSNAITEECAYGVAFCTVCNSACQNAEGDTDLCGDGTEDSPETCDDSNMVTEECAYGEASCMVCSATCQDATGETDVCGDGTEDSAETCDDSNAATEECPYAEASCTVCDATCQDAAGATHLCGDGTEDSVEDCDDGNTTDGDGCEADCTVGTVGACGDGVIDDGEECDDGNTTDGDGCDSECTEPVCGNGVKEPSERCDDGNTTNGDGCSRTCRVEGSGGGGGGGGGVDCYGGNSRCGAHPPLPSGCSIAVERRGATGGVLVMLGLVAIDLLRRLRRGRRPNPS